MFALASGGLLGLTVAAAAGGGLVVEDVSPSRPRAGQELTVRVSAPVADPVQVCLEPGAGLPRCQVAPPGTTRMRFPGAHVGRWTVVARAGGQEASRGLVVRPRGRKLVVLAAGDSLVRPIAKGLVELLRPRTDVTVRQEIHNGSGLTKARPNWMRHAERLAASLRPDVVLVFIGGGDGYPIDGVHCCAPAWIERYAELQRRFMRTLAQDGSARVHWSTLPAPAPRLSKLAWVWNALNQALALAVTDDFARVFDTNALVSPGYRFRRTMRWRDKRWVVRRSDGFHLSRAGGRIAADAFLRQLRSDGVDVPPRHHRP